MQCLSIKFGWKVLIRYTVSGQDAQNSFGAMSCHPQVLVMLLKETVIYNIRLTECKLAIKLRHLFHLSDFHFQQHHENLDYAETKKTESCYPYLLYRMHAK